jgi:hypothetical protein
MVDRSVPVVAKMDKCVVLHPQEPWAILACGTQSPILRKVEVGVIIQLHLKHRHKNVTNPISIAQKANTEICIKAISSKYKAKTELFPKYPGPELTTKNLTNSPNFLTITHTTLSA